MYRTGNSCLYRVEKLCCAFFRAARATPQDSSFYPLNFLNPCSSNALVCSRRLNLFRTPTGVYRKYKKKGSTWIQLLFSEAGYVYDRNGTLWAERYGFSAGIVFEPETVRAVHIERRFVFLFKPHRGNHRHSPVNTMRGHPRMFVVRRQCTLSGTTQNHG